jgi:ribosomal protein S18 acetylase RimI-like enzyme
MAMAGAFTIRRATREDAPGVLACLRAAFEPFREQYPPEGFADTTLLPSTVQDRLASMSVFVAVVPAGEVVGTVGCHVVNQGDGHFRGMAVLPEWQGRGVADALLAAVEDEMRRLGCARATLDTTAPLERAIRFYERHGYRATGRVGDFYGMPLYQYAKAL